MYPKIFFMNVYKMQMKMIDITNSQITLIPEPVELKRTNGYFEITQETKLFVGEKLKKVGEHFQQLLQPSFGWKIPISTKRVKINYIDLLICKENQELGEEGYILKSTKDGIRIEGNTPKGVFYGLQTLR